MMLVGVWCAISAMRIITPIFLLDTTNSKRYSGQIFAPFLENLNDDERGYTFFQQGGVTNHTACNSMAALLNIFGDQIISHPLWPALLRD